MITTSIARTKNICYTIFETANSAESVIVFLHGLGSSQNFYYSTAKRLSSKHTCLVLDNNGAGRTPLSSPDISIESMGQDVFNLLLELDLSRRPLTLVGHSMSGMTVNYMNSEFKNKLEIKQNILLGPVHPTERMIEIFDQRIQSVQKSNSLSDIANSVSENAVGSNCTDLKRAFIRELVFGQNTDGYIANCGIISKAGLQSDAFLELYKKNEKRTLLILGEEDKTAPWDGCASVINDNLQNSQVYQLKGVGHWHAIEDDEKVLEAIESFIK
ncbi:DEHA2C14850p [Debaryomyces hansenii CBS767]|uniref:DEHA2C14850p n=1 Tax=Debaryomyces hansenii (strain ATCC 36239 / CBS 767 / BCRC 21394 / JCM 1990 / NBRC 0083 / IGC 2968) TaxID=284592 RepID=Q6BTZ0_DEBHA|nr:DEHA2C14850p [Debaryomyces hansenii CBS767]CAG86409.2 DEHA2C14850p [Debaryomyces hansenii CBS767]|eukprot:XP_458329.2 DEHA2C14850p [Debaryomyces hansenii CBS767]